MTEQGPSFEEKKWLHELLREDAHRAHDNSNAFHTYVNQATIESANLALRTLIVINGGAAIAVLAFLGAIASKDKIDFAKVGDVANTLRCFAIGVALALVGMALAYLTNYFTVATEHVRQKTYAHPFLVDGPSSKRMKRLTITFHILAFSAALVSLSLFLIGMFAASDKIAHLLVK
jgi:hypothetical protein